MELAENLTDGAGLKSSYGLCCRNLEPAWQTVDDMMKSCVALGDRHNQIRTKDIDNQNEERGQDLNNIPFSVTPG